MTIYMKTDKILKTLRSQKAEIKDRMSAINQQISWLKKEQGELSQKKNTVEQKIGNILRDGKELEVSDHAVVRYLERVEKKDLEQVKHNILTEEFMRIYNELGDGSIPNGNGLVVVVRNRRVVTVKN